VIGPNIFLEDRLDRRIVRLAEDKMFMRPIPGESGPPLWILRERRVGDRNKSKLKE
jgi:hypothetical protein